MADDTPLLNVRETAEKLGKNRSTVVRWANNGTLPVALRTKGNSPRFRRSDIEALLQPAATEVKAS